MTYGHVRSCKDCRTSLRLSHHAVSKEDKLQLGSLVSKLLPNTLNIVNVVYLALLSANSEVTTSV